MESPSNSAHTASPACDFLFRRQVQVGSPPPRPQLPQTCSKQFSRTLTRTAVRSVQTGIASVPAPSWGPTSSDRFSLAPDTRIWLKVRGRTLQTKKAQRGRSIWRGAKGLRPAPRRVSRPQAGCHPLQTDLALSLQWSRESRRKFLGALPSWVRPTFSFSSYTRSLGRLAAGLSTPFRAGFLSSPTEVWPPPEPLWAPGGPQPKPTSSSFPKGNGSPTCGPRHASPKGADADGSDPLKAIAIMNAHLKFRGWDQ